MTSPEKKEESVVEYIAEGYRRHAFNSGISFAALVAYQLLRDKSIREIPWLNRIFYVANISVGSFLFGYIGWPVVWPVVALDCFVRN